MLIKVFKIALIVFIGACLTFFIGNALIPSYSVKITEGNIENISSEKQYRLWQTNASGDDIHIIDVEKQEVIKVLKVGKNPHGIAYSEATNTVYVSIENIGNDRGELLWINADTYEIEKRTFVGDGPHEIEVTPNGEFIYVPCKNNHYWVIDGNTTEFITKIKTGGRPHNTKVSKDGRFMYLSPLGNPRTLTIVNTEKNHEVVGEIKFSNGLRPSTLSNDGKYFFQQVDGLNGFEVADLETNKVVAQVSHKERVGLITIRKKNGWLTNSGYKKCHGLEMRPDQKEIWSVCSNLLRIHDITNNEYKEIFSFDMEGPGYWLTFSPDSKYAFIALAKINQVLVMDAINKKELYRFDVGEAPKRNLVLIKDK